MAAIANSLLNNFVSSVTGNTDKAYILLRRESSVRALSTSTSTGTGTSQNMGTQSSGLVSIASAMSSAAASLTSAVSTEKNTMGLTSASAITSALGDSSENFLPVEVQYNPKMISFHGEQGKQRSGGMGPQEQFRQMDAPVSTTMTVELDFDNTNIKDAFMFERLNLLTVGGVVQTIEAVDTALGTGFSVRDISEVFVGAMVRPASRWMAFVWNKMIFWGELTGVNVKYTMFDPSGNPIRSKVTLTIRQDKSPDKKAYATEQDWDKAFKKMFSSKYMTNSLGLTNNISNLLQY